MPYIRYSLKQKYINGSPVEEYMIGNIIDPDTQFDDIDECNDGNQHPDVPIEGAVYQWIVVDGEYVCDNNNKYFKEKQQISFDNGSSWSNTGLIRKGALMESSSADCHIEPIYRYSVVYGQYMCSGYDKYQKLVKEISYNNGQSWIVVQPEEYIMGSMIERNSEDCGYVPEAIYQWVVVSGEYFCNGTTKYAKERKQVSYDEGVTWNWVVPYEERQGSLIEQQSTDCGYVPPTPPTPSTDYLTFVALEDNFRVTNSSNTFSFSIDGGATWGNYTGISPYVSAGSKILCRRVQSEPTNTGIGRFSSTGRFNVEGNVMSLLFGANFIGQTDLTGYNYAFYQLFDGCTNLVNAENLSLPATTLSDSCYQSMFYECSSLVTAPELPATTLAQDCYRYMFYGCTALRTAPELPATTLANYCYDGMFYGCSSLTTAPELPATTLASYCYQNMFRGCTSLTTAPELPATTLTEFCYNQMFKNCTSLTTAPALPATRLADSCYYCMFQNCTALTTAPSILPATRLRIQCYEYMFDGCTSLTTAPELPATTLAQSCYQYMFQNCTALTTAPSILPATTLAGSCYRYMFYGCTALRTAPELPATTLVSECYEYMFDVCTSLNYIKCLATNISARDCTYRWVQYVPSMGTFVKNAAMTSWTTGTSGIPSGWTVQNA